MTEQKLIRLHKNIILDINNVAMAKVVELQGLSEEPVTYTEIVLRGDKQVYQYQGEIGRILWEILKDRAFPLAAYMQEERK